MWVLEKTEIFVQELKLFSERIFTKIYKCENFPPTGLPTTSFYSPKWFRLMALMGFTTQHVDEEFRLWCIQHCEGILLRKTSFSTSLNGFNEFISENSISTKIPFPANGTQCSSWRLRDRRKQFTLHHEISINLHPHPLPKSFLIDDIPHALANRLSRFHFSHD